MARCDGTGEDEEPTGTRWLDLTGADSAGTVSTGAYGRRRFPAGTDLGTSDGAILRAAGRGCSLRMWSVRRFVDTCSPQNRHRALPGEKFTCCIASSMADAVSHVKEVDREATGETPLHFLHRSHVKPRCQGSHLVTAVPSRRRATGEQRRDLALPLLFTPNGPGETSRPRSLSKLLAPGDGALMSGSTECRQR